MMAPAMYWSASAGEIHETNRYRKNKAYLVRKRLAQARDPLGFHGSGRAYKRY